MRFISYCAAAALGLAAFSPAPAAAQSATATGISRDFNPAISVNALLLYTSGLNEEGADHAHEDGDEEDRAHGITADGFYLQETELQLTSIIDPYAKADLVFAMHGTESFELEEGFAEFLFLPRGLGLRAGKYYFRFGKHNVYHTHQFPFVEKPAAWDELLDTHGLNGMAIEGSWLTPLPWYAEVIGYGFPLIETVYGDHDLPKNTWGGGARLRQLWETSERSTLDLGLSWAGGDLAPPDDGHSAGETGTRHFFGADLTYKRTGTGANPRRLELQSEWLRRVDVLGSKDKHRDGFYVHLLARVSRRIHLGGRFDLYQAADEEQVYLDKTDRPDENDDISTWTASLAFVPSEFQSFRIDFLHRHWGGSFGGDDQGVRVQYNFTIGSHPAHRY